MTKRVYRSMQGKIVDMELLASRNELAPAIGNVRVNARGDELGPGGKIVRKREDIMAEYYNNNPNAVSEEQFIKKQPPVFTPPTNKENNSVKREPTKREVKNDIKDDPSNP